MLKMKDTARHLLIILLGLGLSLPAHAYIDPGTGSLIVQTIIGAIAAASITAKLWWHKLKVFLFRSKTDTESEEPAEGDLKE